VLIRPCNEEPNALLRTILKQDLTGKRSLRIPKLRLEDTINRDVKKLGT